MTTRRWSISIAVMIVAALISSVAFVHAKDGLIFLSIVLGIVVSSALARKRRR